MIFLDIKIYTLKRMIILSILHLHSYSYLSNLCIKNMGPWVKVCEQKEQHEQKKWQKEAYFQTFSLFRGGQSSIYPAFYSLL